MRRFRCEGCGVTFYSMERKPHCQDCDATYGEDAEVEAPKKGRGKRKQDTE